MRKSFKNRNFFSSLYYALSGLYYAFVRERNFRVHLIIAILVIIAGLFFKISRFDWILLTIAISIVVITELTNTAIEFTVDLFTKKEHIRAKLAKDVAAGAVLVASVFAVVIGFLVFYNKLWSLLTNLNG
ncbi:MAG: diacylglycerol kinase family protein [Candidatus Margulisbacteria bacterium]|nr:diacylglycerol kinase family protein [Candidatus Margulisiibacteriota bacterium]